METGQFHPKDFIGAADRESPQDKNLFEARCWRCRACFFAQSQEHQMAALCIDEAESALGRVSASNPEKIYVQIYLRSIDLFNELNSPDGIRGNFERRLNKIIFDALLYVKDDKILIAGLYDMLIDFTNDHSMYSREDKFVKLQSYVSFIHLNLRDTVPGYCFLKPEILKLKNKKLIQSAHF